VQLGLGRKDVRDTTLDIGVNTTRTVNGPDRVDTRVRLGDVEEWTIRNTTGDSPMTVRQPRRAARRP
jgi:hypothetical protein